MSAFLDISMQRINTLNPKLIPSATRVFEKCQKEKIPIYVVWGLRTIDQQDLMFRFGRTIPGKILTTRRGGYSAHNYGCALDFCLLFNKELLSWEDVYPRDYWRNKWLKVVRYFEEEGWESGWRWPSFEPGHVENLLGNTLTSLYERFDNRNNGFQNIRE
jgi:peptidoglycan L-alanyl-D-glutamate endopeptidase CwlK